MSKVFMIINEDRFFLSHRRPVAEAARKVNFKTVIVTKDTGFKVEIKKLGFKVLDLPINPTGMNLFQELRTMSYLYRLYRREKPDIVHHVGLKNILWGGIAARMAHVKGVVNAVSGLGSLFNGERLSMTAKGVVRAMRFVNNSHNVKFIFQNNDDLDIFTKHKVVKPDQVEFTKGSGVDLNEYAPVVKTSEGRVNIIFTARMVKEKGVMDLIEAANILKPDYADRISFTLCGRLTPNKTGVTEEYMRSHCDGAYINWLGECDNVKEMLGKSHIMAFPSYYREGVPKSLIEAAACGLPIVTCDSTGCRDVVDDALNGFLIEPKNPEMLAEKLKILIDNKELRERMGRESRLKAEREFGIEKVVETNLRIYKELLNN